MHPQRWKSDELNNMILILCRAVFTCFQDGLEKPHPEGDGVL